MIDVSHPGHTPPRKFEVIPNISLCTAPCLGSPMAMCDGMEFQYKLSTSTTQLQVIDDYQTDVSI